MVDFLPNSGVISILELPAMAVQYNSLNETNTNWAPNTRLSPTDELEVSLTLARLNLPQEEYFRIIEIRLEYYFRDMLTDHEICVNPLVRNGEVTMMITKYGTIPDDENPTEIFSSLSLEEFVPMFLGLEGIRHMQAIRAVLLERYGQKIEEEA